MIMDANATWTSRPQGRIVARRRRSGIYADLQNECEEAIRNGIGRLEIDLTGVEKVEASLLRCLTAILRMARRHRVALRLRPSLALDRWLALSGLDSSLEPVR